MGIAFLDSKKLKKFDINGIIEDYYVYAGENISAGDFVNYINGIAEKINYGTSTDTQLSNIEQTAFTMSAVVLDDNRIFIAHSHTNNAYYLYGKVIKIDGKKIIVGTDTRILSESYSGYIPSATVLENGKVFITTRMNSANTYLYAIVCTITDMIITAGNMTQISSCTFGYANAKTLLLPDGKVFVAHSHGKYYHLYGIVCSISGTTITAGTDTGIIYTDYAGFHVSILLLEDGNVFLTYYVGRLLEGIICSVSNTTITTNTDTELTAIDNSAFAISTALLEYNKVFVSHRVNNYNLYGMICTINGTMITKGTDTLIKQNTDTDTVISYSSALTLPSGNILVIYNYNGNYLYSVICGISNTTITLLNSKQLNDDSYSGFLAEAILLNNKIIIPHSMGSSYYLYAQIFCEDKINNVLTNEISDVNYEQQVTPSTQPPFDGIALSSGVGGDDTGHNEQVKIARPITEQDIYVFETFTSSPIPTSWANGEDGLTATATNDYGEWSLRTTKGPWTTGTNLGVITDGNDDTGWRFARFSSDSEVAYMYLTPPAGVEINPTSIYVYNNMCSSSSDNSSHRSKLQGYDGSNWIDLGTLNSGTAGVKQTFTISGDTFFSEFRLEIYRFSEAYNTEVYIFEFQVREGTIRCLKPEYQ